LLLSEFCFSGCSLRRGSKTVADGNPPLHDVAAAVRSGPGKGWQACAFDFIFAERQNVRSAKIIFRREKVFSVYLYNTIY